MTETINHIQERQTTVQVVVIIRLEVMDNGGQEKAEVDMEVEQELHLMMVVTVV